MGKNRKAVMLETGFASPSKSMRVLVPEEDSKTQI